jgi:hypothetical protein
MTWQRINNHRNYEIFTEFPYLIRKTYNGRIVNEREKIKGTGLVQVKLNGVNYSKNRIIAEQFIPNPENLLGIAHINGSLADTRIENLEWLMKEEVPEVIDGAQYLMTRYTR